MYGDAEEEVPRNDALPPLALFVIPIAIPTNSKVVTPYAFALIHGKSIDNTKLPIPRPIVLTLTPSHNDMLEKSSSISVPVDGETAHCSFEMA